LPLSFHPGTALVKRRIRETRELGCDELVTEKLLDAAVYARSLVYLAGSAINLSRPGATITVGIADADILEERVMTILRRPKTITRRRNLLLVATALIFVVPCVAAAPYSLRIGVDPQSPAVSSDDSVAAPHASDALVQQASKQEERATEEQRRKLRELREERLTPKVSQIKAAIKVRKLRDAPSMQEMEERKKVKETEVKLQDEHDVKKPVLKRKGQRKLEPEIIYSLKRVAAKKTSNAELAKKANITMQQAIQIAMSQQPGTVMQCRLIGEHPAGERDQVFYILTIVSGDEPKSASTTMLISAVDGRVVRTWKNER
jgi:uncharacterized membrane protein YkoI